jgi:hypothetical protein
MNQMRNPRSFKLHQRTWFVGSMGAILASAVLFTTVAIGAGSAAATSHGRVAHQRPVGLATRAHGRKPLTLYPVTALTQEFSTNTQYFCPAGSGNAPCDGNGGAADYGTIDRVAGGFSNGGYGNYAPSTPALDTGSGGGYMALVSGTGDGNQGTGCPGTTPTSNPGEACTGPYALFGTGAAEGVENVFPTGGFTVTDDLYLSPSTVGPLGSLVDDDVELNNNSGTYGIDNIITACAESPSSTVGFVINFGNGSPGSCTGTPQVTTDGWYRFVFVFSDVTGYAYVTESVYSETTGTPRIATSSPQPVGGTPTSISDWGGPGYFWLPTEDMSGLPLANFVLQLGIHSKGKRA